MSANTIIIIATVLLSITCFKNRTLFYKLSLNPYDVYHRQQIWRVITHGFIHADYTHLLINMLVLWSFGGSVENIFNVLEQQGVVNNGTLTYVLLYLSALIFSSMYDVITKKANYRYNSIGASGAVSAIVFCSIFFSPWSKIYVMALLPVPGIIFGALYLWYSQYMSKHGRDNTNHLAHLWGAVYGLIFPIILDPKLLNHFINSLLNASL